MVLEKLDSHIQKNETRPLSHIIHKNHSKWIKDLNIRPETIKFLEENIGSILFYIGHSNIFLGMPPQTRKTKGEMNKWDYIKLKSFCTAKQTINKMKIY